MCSRETYSLIFVYMYNTIGNFWGYCFVFVCKRNMSEMKSCISSILKVCSYNWSTDTANVQLIILGGFFIALFRPPVGVCKAYHYLPYNNGVSLGPCRKGGGFKVCTCFAFFFFFFLFHRRGRQLLLAKVKNANGRIGIFANSLYPLWACPYRPILCNEKFCTTRGQHSI